MSEETEKTEEKEFKVEEILIEGCMTDQAKQVISQMLERRLAELDPTGLQAKFIMKLQNEINEMPDCKEMFKKEEEKTE